ncbi:hypothetical protein FA95DRAFT_1602013 [Auriscalpium vulgare]|uniref:Uncharacterized protein n=1 Tax=Auriscalpium vulgare TaxID=40419 RepID=A0ACB8S8R4_9AGAM|nr:hypothetical protein FA95DRAFT_1602013 [Auriscalpium vulgare]
MPPDEEADDTIVRDELRALPELELVMDIAFILPEAELAMVRVVTDGDIDFVLEGAVAVDVEVALESVVEVEFVDVGVVADGEGEGTATVREEEFDSSLDRPSGSGVLPPPRMLRGVDDSVALTDKTGLPEDGAGGRGSLGGEPELREGARETGGDVEALDRADRAGTAAADRPRVADKDAEIAGGGPRVRESEAERARVAGICKTHQ